MTSFLYAPGALFIHRGVLSRIIRVTAVNEVLIEPFEGESRVDRRETVSIDLLLRVPRPSRFDREFRRLVTEASPEAWGIAKFREGLIRPLWERPKCTKAMLCEAAEQLGVSERKAYYFLEAYRQCPMTAALLPKRRGAKAAISRLPVDVEDLITEVIEDLYLKRQRRPISKIVEEAELRCRRCGLKPPSRKAIQRRIEAIPLYERLRKRHSARKADALGPAPGRMPNVDCPLALVQMDHTLVDKFVVDEVWREVIGRPLLTIAIDVFSRMVTGFALTLFDPCSMVVGLTVVHSVCAKDGYLSRFRIESPWPVWGKPGIFHVDNAKPHRGRAMETACCKHGIELDFRPVACPRFGGHVERLIGTMMGKVHLLPGTTFSNVIQKDDYDPAKHAVMTLAELEEWLTIQIVEIYHKTRHRGIGEPPLKRWERALVGDDLNLGLGLPGLVEHPDTLFRDFLPDWTRTVRREGIVLDCVWYWTDALKELQGKSVAVRRDPRDLSRIYLQDPVGPGAPGGLDYLVVPYADLSRPPINIWEHKAAKRRLAEEGARIDEAAIFRAIERQREIEEGAASKSRAARRNIARRPVKQRPERPLLEMPADESDRPGQRVKRRFDDIRGLGALRPVRH